MNWFIVQAVLLSLIGAMVVILITGTVYALVRPASSGALFRLGSPGNFPEGNLSGGGQTGISEQNSNILVYSGIGRLRIPLSDSSVMILSIAFPYPADDASFAEEIAAKTDDFRNIALNYFSSLPPEKLANFDEEQAKQDIIKNYNSVLRLGRIEAVYFSDLLVMQPY